LTTQELTTATDSVIVGVVMMDADEARQIVKNIQGRLAYTRRELLELHDREGWRALGYSSWGACVKAEFAESAESAATLYRQLEAAIIERDVLQDSQVENPAPIPTAQLQQVKQLAPADRLKAFRRADQLAGDGPRTARHVEQAAAEIAQPDLPVDFSIVKRRYETHGITLTHKIHSGALLFVRQEKGGTPVATMDWQNVLDKLSLLEDGMDDAYTPAETEEAPVAQQPPADLVTAGVELRKYGAWFTAVGARGLMRGWEIRTAAPFAQIVERARQEIARRTPPPAVEPEPEIARPVAVPPRPRRPVSADVSATVRYLNELETYASALESYIMELQKKIR